MALRAVLVVVLGLAACVAAALAWGAVRWRGEAARLAGRMDAARVRGSAPAFDPKELEGLPAPVQRYLRAVLRDGQPRVAAATLRHAGTFNMGGGVDRWVPFTSVQRVVARRPGFVWDARIRLLPGLAVRVHDGYAGGEGVTHASLFGFLSVADMRGTPELAEGQLVRFLAEAAWYPTALLPGAGVRWEAVDEASARGTLTDGPTRASLLFRFDQAGLIASVRAEARGRTVNGAVVPTPWEGRFWSYEVRAGMRIPTEGEVAWLLSEGPKPYWRGRITGIRFELEP